MPPFQPAAALRRLLAWLWHQEGSHGQRARGLAAGVMVGLAGAGLALGLAVAGGDDDAGLDVVTPPTSSVPGTVVIITTTTTTTPAPTVLPGPTSTAPPSPNPIPPPPVLLAHGDTVVRWTPTTSEVVIEGDGAITAAFDDLAGGYLVDDGFGKLVNAHLPRIQGFGAGGPVQGKLSFLVLRCRLQRHLRMRREMKRICLFRPLPAVGAGAKRR